MMVNKNIVLNKLAPFTNLKKVLIQDQNTSDIIQGILNNHYKYENEYDKISEMFIGSDEIETARNIYNFLKKNVPYYIEPIEKQTLRSPSAILSMTNNNGKILGADCKSYATFINGIMSSLNRKGIYNVPLSYRFASYRYDKKEPEHVFSVLYPNTKNEIWVDPVLNDFNYKKEPVFIKDKPRTRALAVFPDSAWTSRLCDARTTTVLAGIRAGGTNSIAFPSACSRRSVAMMEPEPGSVRPLTVAGAAQVRSAVWHLPSCFPLNCAMRTTARAPTGAL